MFEKILVPLDGSELAESILTQVSRLYHAKDSAIVLLRVVPPPSKRTAGAEEQTKKEEIEAFDYVKGIAARLEERGIVAKPVVSKGKPEEVIPAYAAKERVDLVTLSTHGRSGVSRWVRGSVAERVMRTTDAPLLLLHSFEKPGTEQSDRRRSAEVRIAKILMPIDGSQESEAIVPHGRALAAMYESEVTVFHAVYVHPALGLYPQDIIPIPPSIDVAFVEATAARLRELGVKAVAKTVYGEPAWEITEELRTKPYDLVAMATHGRRGLERLVLGSDAEKLLRAITVPMLLVHARE